MPNWSSYQDEIFENFQSSRGNIVVEAYAGTGKTTTIEEGVQRVSPRQRIAVMAFNRPIANILSERIKLRNAKINTISGFGKAALHRAFGDFEVVEDRADAFARKAAEDRDWWQYNAQNEKRPRYVGSICQLVRAAKNAGLGAEQVAQVRDLAIDKELDDLATITVEELAGAACQVLEDCETFGGSIDFEDMAWLPYRLKLTPRNNDLVVVDESQDLNEPQLYLAKAYAREGGRVAVVGDRHQAIYQFRGAGKGMFTRLVEELAGGGRGTVLKLPVTYRCSYEVVQLARQIVPDFEAAPGAPAGSVSSVRRNELLQRARPGDFIISRSNAPLVEVLLEAIDANIPCVIAGRDVGKGLLTLMDKFSVQTVDGLLKQLGEHSDREIRRAKELDRPLKAERMADRVGCLMAFARGVDSLFEMRARIERYFSDDDQRSKLTLTTTHKAKGLERENVYMLESTFAKGMNSEEGRNLWYVAVTRAKTNLIMVREPVQ